MNNKYLIIGIATLLIILSIFSLWFIYNEGFICLGCGRNFTDGKVCTEEAKICPDGSAVGRVPPDCRFAPCPSCKCPEGYVLEGDVCNPGCYYSTPKCLAPSIMCNATINQSIENLCIESGGMFQFNWEPTTEQYNWMKSNTPIKSSSDCVRYGGSCRTTRPISSTNIGYCDDGTFSCWRVDVQDPSGGVCLLPQTNKTIEELCTNSGGTVTTQLCCKSASDFPNTCLIGACGCSPDNSHNVKVCDCGEGKCWDSTKQACVTQ